MEVHYIIINHIFADFFLCSLPELPLTPSSGWFSVLSRVHSASPEQLMEMHHEQANPKNAVVSAVLTSAAWAPVSTLDFCNNNEICDRISWRMMFQVWVIQSFEF